MNIYGNPKRSIPIATPVQSSVQIYYHTYNNDAILACAIEF